MNQDQKATIAFFYSGMQIMMVIPELKKVFLTGLNRPFGMLILNDKFYVANTDGILVFPYKEGQTEMTSPGKKYKPARWL